jgi:LacI family transcriptional regulator
VTFRLLVGCHPVIETVSNARVVGGVLSSSEHAPDRAANVPTVPRISSDAASPGDYRRTTGRTTLAAIAAEAGVSLPTVSKVNGRPDVAAGTRARVERLLDEHHYARTGAGQQLRSGLIDLVFNGLDSPWAVEILRGAEEWAASHEDRRRRLGGPARQRPARQLDQHAGKPRHRRRDPGDLRPHREQLEQLRSAGIPLVMVDPANPPPPELPSVGTTNWAGGLAATEHLLSLGHRRIAAIGGPEDYLCSRARIDGYRSALERAGVVRGLPARGGFRARWRTARPAGPPDRHLRGRRPARARRLRGGAPARCASRRT